MKTFRQLSEASVHPMAVHAYPSGKNQFTVHAVGSKVKHVSPGEKVSSSDLDDLSDAGHKVKEIAKPINEAAEHEESGRGKHKVTYVHPDKKNIGNDRFETKPEAIKYANSLKKKGYHDVSMSEEVEHLDEADLTKIDTKTLQSLTQMHKYYGQKDPRAKASAERGEAELKRRDNEKKEKMKESSLPPHLAKLFNKKGDFKDPKKHAMYKDIQNKMAKKEKSPKLPSVKEDVVDEGIIKGTASLVKHAVGVPMKAAGRAAMGAVNAVHAVAGGVKNTVKDVKDASKKVKAAYAEEAELDESGLSSKTLANYSIKASDASKHRTMPTKKVDNRYAGVSKVDKILAMRDKKKFD